MNAANAHVIAKKDGVILRQAQDSDLPSLDEIGVVCGDDLELEVEVPGSLIEDLLHTDAEEIVASGAVSVPAEETNSANVPTTSTAPASCREPPVSEILSHPAGTATEWARGGAQEASKNSH